MVFPKHFVPQFLTWQEIRSYVSFDRRSRFQRSSFLLSRPDFLPITGAGVFSI